MKISRKYLIAIIVFVLPLPIGFLLAWLGGKAFWNSFPLGVRQAVEMEQVDPTILSKIGTFENFKATYSEREISNESYPFQIVLTGSSATIKEYCTGYLKAKNRLNYKVDSLIVVDQ